MYANSRVPKALVKGAEVGRTSAQRYLDAQSSRAAEMWRPPKLSLSAVCFLRHANCCVLAEMQACTGWLDFTVAMNTILLIEYILSL